MKISRLSILLLLSPSVAHAARVTIQAVNPMSVPRTSQTLEISAAQLAPLQAKDLNFVHIVDAKGEERVCQAIDLDGDPLRTFDAVIFQADFAAGETLTFTAQVGERQVYQKDQFKAFGRFVRERFDDFTWENDLVAHRTYGAALETWEGEPLSSSTIDVWSKRTSRMVINDWYLADDYHVDHGEGADFYSAGVSRGCGGSGLWADERLWVSRNFTHSKVLANGPIRVLFELQYPPFEVNGISVKETKRVSLDAGSYFNHFRSIYQPYTRPGQKVTLTHAAGLKKVAGELVEPAAPKGCVVKWEKMEKNAGFQGLALVARPDSVEGHAADAQNLLLLVRPDESNTAEHWAGSCWDKAGVITTPAQWKEQSDSFFKGLASPITLTVTTAP